MLKNTNKLNVNKLNVNKLNVDKLNGNKSVKIYKSPLWVYFILKIKNVPYKFIYPDELVNDIPYCITMEKYNNLLTLMCNGCIIYQQASWFAFNIEFILADPDINSEPINLEPINSEPINLEPSFYECIIKDINYNNSNIYINN